MASPTPLKRENSLACSSALLPDYTTRRIAQNTKLNLHLGSGLGCNYWPAMARTRKFSGTIETIYCNVLLMFGEMDFIETNAFVCL